MIQFLDLLISKFYFEIHTSNINHVENKEKSWMNLLYCVILINMII